jgi:hypothetical protein
MTMAGTSRICQGARRGRRIFPAECCFQVIYFISNISFLPLAGSRLAAPRGNHPVNKRG